MIYVGMLTDLQQTNLIPNFSTRTEMGSVRQKVGIKNWELRNPTQSITLVFTTVAMLTPMAWTAVDWNPVWRASQGSQSNQSAFTQPGNQRAA